MNRLINVFLLINAVIFALPPLVSVLDMMCWFYTTHTCSGLDWTDMRPVIALTSAFVTVITIMLIHENN